MGALIQKSFKRWEYFKVAPVAGVNVTIPAGVYRIKVTAVGGGSGYANRPGRSAIWIFDVSPGMVVNLTGGNYGYTQRLGAAVAPTDLVVKIDGVEKLNTSGGYPVEGVQNPVLPVITALHPWGSAGDGATDVPGCGTHGAVKIEAVE